MIEEPSYTIIKGSFILPSANDIGIRQPIEKGQVTFKRGYISAAGKYIALAEQFTVKIVDGELEKTQLLSNSVWQATIEPFGVSYRHQFHFIPEGEELDLRDVVAVRINGLDYVRGPGGLSAYEIARLEGYTGSRDQWVVDTKGQNVGISMELLADGSARISGPGLEILSDGSALINSTIQPDVAPPWSVNELAFREGRPILSLFHDPVAECLYSGYGDWGANGDEIGIVRHHLFTGQSQVMYFPKRGENKTYPGFNRNGAYTEAVLNFYRSDEGSMYVPHIDGAGYWEGCGYITNEGGEWHEVNLPHQAVHVFNVAENSQGLWMCGSAFHTDQQTAGPALWFRPTGGTWYLFYLEPMVAGVLGSERYYEMRVIDDRVHVLGMGRTDMMPTWAKRSFKFVPRTDGEPYEGTTLPAEAYDMETSTPTGMDQYSWNNFYDDTASVDGWNYYGGSNGRIMRKKAGT